MQFIPLIFQHVSQINCYFPCNLLHKVIKFSQVIRQSNKLIKCSNLFENIMGNSCSLTDRWIFSHSSFQYLLKRFSIS